MDRYNVGQIVTATEDIEVVGCFSDEKQVIKKGTKGWVTASKGYPALYLENGSTFLLDKDNTELIGFDAEGIAEWIFRHLRNRTHIDDMMEDYDVTEDDIKSIISEALEELEFYPGEVEESEDKK